MSATAIAIARARGRVLLIEEHRDSPLSVGPTLRGANFDTVTLEAAALFESPWKTDAHDVILSDVRLADGMSGHDVLLSAREADLRVPVVLMATDPDAEGAVSAIHQGAFDYLAKPVDPALLFRTLNAAIRRSTALREQPQTPKLHSAASVAAALVGTSRAVQSLRDLVRQLAATSTPVVISGERGTGKEQIARSIHAQSPRAALPFVAFECAGMPAAIVSAELFGRAPRLAARTHSPARGAIASATRGTLLLNEADRLPMEMRAEFVRTVGGRVLHGMSRNAALPRVLAAVNVQSVHRLSGEPAHERLRRELGAVTLEVPALRNRAEDITPLADHLLTRHAARLGSPRPGITREALSLLERYSFPGNVAELSHILEHALLTTYGEVITPDDLPADVSGEHAVDPPDLGIAIGIANEWPALELAQDWPTIEELHRRYVACVLSATSGDRARAAKVLGLHKRSLLRMFARPRQ